jgi:hypothetical protein
VRNEFAVMKLRNGAVLAPPPISNGTILRRILALAGPTGVVSVLQVTAQLIDTWLAAQQGTLALAGWAVVLPFTLLLQQMSSGAMGGGVSSAIARALGAGKTEEAVRTGTSCHTDRDHHRRHLRHCPRRLPAHGAGRDRRATGSRGSRVLCEVDVRSRRDPLPG